MPSSSRTAAAVAATAAIATLVLAPPPDVSAALSVFDMRNLDNSIAALGLWPNKEMAARGDLAGWCISNEDIRPFATQKQALEWLNEQFETTWRIRAKFWPSVGNLEWRG